MKHIVLMFAITLYYGGVLAQDKQLIHVTGRILSEEDSIPLAGATISAHHVDNTVPLISTVANEAGYFIASAPYQDNLELTITYLGYNTFKQVLKIKNDILNINLGDIILQRTGVTLATIEIKNPIVVKKDTIEFDASHFLNRKSALVEELLKRLPGVFIQRDGSITIQGEVVKKIMINGRPYFLDDPAFVTKNLSADLIEKVQVINGKSEEEEFTGVNDGRSEKVINLTIKDMGKSKINGRLTAGYGTEERYAINGNINQFKDVYQLSIIANGNNTNGLDLGESTNNNEGITRTWNAGGNFNGNIGPRITVDLSYMLNNRAMESRSTSTRQTILPDTSWLYNQGQELLKERTDNALNFQMKYDIDSIQELSLTSRLKYSTTKTVDQYHYASTSNSGNHINDGTVFNSIESSTREIFSTLTYRRKLGKPGRTISANLKFGYQNYFQPEYNISNSTYTNEAGAAITDSLNRLRRTTSNHRFYQLGFVYTEPVLKSNNLRISYLSTISSYDPITSTFDYSKMKKSYDQFNDSLSNSFKNRNNAHFLSATLRANKQSYDYSVGLNMLSVTLNNTNFSASSKMKKTFDNISPTATFNYRFSRTKSLWFNYSSNTETPSIDLLRTIPDYSDPLFIKTGNPKLLPARNDQVTLNYNTFNPGKQGSFSINLNASIISDKIVTTTRYDSIGRQISRPENLDGAWNIRSSIGTTLPINSKIFNAKINTALGYNRDVNLVNGIKGTVSNLTLGPSLHSSIRIEKLLDLEINATTQYNNLKYSTQETNTQYFSHYLSTNVDFYLPFGFTLGCSFDFTINTGRAAGYDGNIAMLNAYVSKSLFKNKKGLLKLNGFDILNRNVGIQRNVGENYIEDVNAIILQRFFLLSFAYFLNAGK